MAKDATKTVIETSETEETVVPDVPATEPTEGGGGGSGANDDGSSGGGATPTETPSEQPAPAVSAVPTLFYNSQQGVRLMEQLEKLESLSVNIRSNIYSFLASENHKGLSEGEQTLFMKLSMVTHASQKMAIIGQGVMTKEILVDNDGDVVEEEEK